MILFTIVELPLDELMWRLMLIMALCTIMQLLADINVSLRCLAEGGLLPPKATPRLPYQPTLVQPRPQLMQCPVKHLLSVAAAPAAVPAPIPAVEAEKKES